MCPLIRCLCIHRHKPHSDAASFIDVKEINVNQHKKIQKCVCLFVFVHYSDKKHSISHRQQFFEASDVNPKDFQKYKSIPWHSDNVWNVSNTTASSTMPVFPQMNTKSRDKYPSIIYLCRNILWKGEVSQPESGHWHLTMVTSPAAVLTDCLQLLNICFSAFVVVKVLPLPGFLIQWFEVSWVNILLVGWIRGKFYWSEDWAIFAAHSQLTSAT